MSQKTKRPRAKVQTSASAVPKGITKAELIVRLGESPKQIERYLVEGMPSEGEGRDRRFPWPACRHWRDERIRKQLLEKVKGADRGPESRKEAVFREAVADAQLKELKLAQLRGELVYKSEYRRELSDVLKRVAAIVQREVPKATADKIFLLIREAVPDPIEEEVARPPEPTPAAAA